MVMVDKFFDYIAPHAPDAPDDLIQFLIQDSVVDFLIDTRLATEFYRFKLHDKVNDYVLDIPSCHTILDVREVLVGTPCEQSVDWSPITKNVRREWTGYFLDIHNTGQPALWIGEPVRDGVVEVEYIYTIGREACEIPDFVYNQYARVIQALVLSRLYTVNGQEWFNASLAGHYLQQYEKELARIKRETRKIKGGNLVSKPFIRGGGRCCYGGFFRV